MSYFRDWFGRDAEHGYTGFSSSKRYIDWDRGYDNYSDFFFSSKRNFTIDKESKSKLDIPSTSQILMTMSKVLGLKIKQFSPILRSGHITLPTDLLKKDDITTDVFIGASLQSMSHNIHTTAEERTKIRLLNSGKSSIKKFVTNALNAERINKLMSEDTPGYLKFVKKYKEYMFKDRPKSDVSESPQKRFIDLFDRIIRYPENITEAELEEFKEPIEKIQKIISKDGGIPNDYGDCVKMSNKISKVIQDFFESEKAKSEKPEDGDDGGDDEEDESDLDSGGSGSPDGESKKESKEKFAVSRDIEKTMKDIMDSYSTYENPKDTELSKEFFDIYKNTEESGSKTGTKATFISAPKDSYSSKQYDDIKSKINLTKASVISKLLKRKSRDHAFAVKSVRSGRLDTNKLAEAKQKVSTIYERIGTVKTDKLAVVVLVDESGSMGGMKMIKAKEAAVFLAESLKNVSDVELFIYGHTADQPAYGGIGSTQVYTYYEPGFTSTEAIAKMSAKYENRDGDAISSVAKRVRHLTDKNAVFVVISDGEPSATNYRGKYARDETRKSVKGVEKMGFQVIQVTIGGYRSHDMFTHVINMDDISTFPTQFVTFLKKKVNSLIKEKITM